MARKRNREEHRILEKATLAEGAIQVLSSLIRWGSIVAITRYAYLAIDSLSGKNTLADIGVNFLTDIKVSVAIAWSAGVGGMVYGARQRKLRKDTVARLQERVRDLESEINPNRSSSNFTRSENIKEEDKV